MPLTRALGECRPPSRELNPDHSQYIFMDPDSDPDLSQNQITCSLSHLGHILKISSKSVHKFWSYLSLKIPIHGSKRTR